MLAEIHCAGRRECTRSERPSLLQYLSVVVRPNMAASLIHAKPVGSFGFGTPPRRSDFSDTATASPIFSSSHVVTCLSCAAAFLVTIVGSEATMPAIAPQLRRARPPPAGARETGVRRSLNPMALTGVSVSPPPAGSSRRRHAVATTISFPTLRHSEPAYPLRQYRQSGQLMDERPRIGRIP